ncbi:MAG: gluconate 2-dehydrogenase subunit 3 family protein [Pseudomonadota bacterium]
MNNRRAFLGGTTVLMTHALFPSVMAAFAASCANNAPHTPTFFTADEMATLKALVDVILPETDSPAASVAKTHEFIDLVTAACASPAQQQTLRKGLGDLDAQAQTQHSAKYATLTTAQQAALLTPRAEADQALDFDASFFKILKDYAFTGYFLSEIGATQALAYEQVPGGYIGVTELTPGQKAWAI